MSTPATETQTPPTITPVLVGNQPLPCHARQNTRGKGAEKNAPMLVAAYAGSRPNWSEVSRISTLLGDSNMAAAIDVEIVRPLFTAASKEGRVTNPDGTVSIDHGKFTQALKDLLANFANNQSAKAQAEAALAEVEEKIVELSRAMLTAQIEGRKLDQAEINKANQLLLKQAELKDKLAKTKKNAGNTAPVTVAAQPAPAAAPAPAK